MTVVVTKAAGGNAKPVGVSYVEPGLQMEPAPPGLVDAGVDAGRTADLLSGCLAHERCGVQLYRSVAARTLDDELRTGYLQFLDETAEHVELLEEFVKAGGGDPMYVSPSARATEKAGSGLLESTYLLRGSIDDETAELTMLEAVMLAEAKDQANWEVLAALAEQMADSAARTQLQALTARVLAQEEAHVTWARRMREARVLALAVGMEPGTIAPVADGAVEGLVDIDGLSRDELYTKAQELEIEGRSQMKKDELADAVSREIGDRK